MNTASYPVIRLMPKVRPQAFLHGVPWVYDNEMVTDRRTKNIAPGSVGILEDAERRPIAQVAVNPMSRLFARILELDLTVEINQGWLEQKLKRALALRETMYDQPYYRLVHAEADGLPGVVIDRFDEIVVVQANAAWIENLLPELTAALGQLPGVKTIYKNASGRARGLEGLDDVSAVLTGQLPDAPMPVPMNGAIYMADLSGGQKTGLFFDQRPNHAFAARFAKGARVLDMFSHVGGFSLAALANGAKSALAVDGSDPALALARGGAQAMGKADQFETRKGDAFDVLTKLAEEGEIFDVVICDPPAFAPSKKALEAGLRAYERIARLAAPLVAEGGYLGLCSCSHAADLSKFRSSSTRGIGRGGRSGQLIHTGYAGPDHPLHPQLAESGYLKALFYRL